MQYKIMFGVIILISNKYTTTKTSDEVNYD